MKKPLFIICIAFILILVSQLCFSQGYDPYSQYNFEDTGEKSEKKIQELPRNFEVIQGRQINTKPIDMVKFKSAINSSIQYLMASNSKYTISTHQEGKGFIFIRVRRPPAWVDIKICYWEDEYWYEYWDSYKMSAVPAANRIHDTYRGYIIKQLERGIHRFYR